MVKYSYFFLMFKQILRQSIQVFYMNSVILILLLIEV